jgi:glutamine amidotransferase
MCEIFCLNSNKPQQVNECLECFYRHSNNHPHGWGLANMQQGNIMISKEAQKASCSKQLKDILANPLVSKNVFAHIRLATVGKIISPNCHPFTKPDASGRTWMLIHNGTIFNYPPLNKYKKIEKGDTDSERILLYIIDKINEFEKEKQSQSTIKERFNILLEVITDISKDNKLNLMIHDGQATYIHSNMRQTLHYLKGEDSFLVATTPVTEDEGWKEVELNKLFALVDGNIIYESKEHINEFIQTKKHEEYLNKSIKSIKEDE